MKIDVTFDIKAQRKIIADDETVFIVTGLGDTEIWMQENEWQAFKTLLQPSTKADFSLTEVDEDGRQIKG